MSVVGTAIVLVAETVIVPWFASESVSEAEMAVVTVTVREWMEPPEAVRVVRHGDLSS